MARGGVTDLAGAAKLAGKTTFAMCMARAVVTGGWFMGRRAERSPVVYLSEQGNNVEKALRDARIDEDLEDLYILPKRLVLGVPWPSVVEAAVEQCVGVGAGFLVADTFNRFAGLAADKENNAGDVGAAMSPLIEAAQKHGLAVLCIRHANHEGRGRGSTQFYHDVDVVMTMRAPDATMPANVRVIEAVGRYDGIPARTNVEFREGGTYVDLGSDSKIQSKRAEGAVKDLLAPGREVVGADLIQRAAEASGASTGTINNVLTTLLDAGTVERIGKGRKGDPYRYRNHPGILSFNAKGTPVERKNESEGGVVSEATPPDILSSNRGGLRLRERMTLLAGLPKLPKTSPQPCTGKTRRKAVKGKTASKAHPVQTTLLHQPSVPRPAWPTAGMTLPRWAGPGATAVGTKRGGASRRPRRSSTKAYGARVWTLRGHAPGPWAARSGCSGTPCR